MLTLLSREKVAVVRKREEVKCPKCGQIMDIVQVYRRYEDEDDDKDESNW
jgi:hypothetical protein